MRVLLFLSVLVLPSLASAQTTTVDLHVTTVDLRITTTTAAVSEVVVVEEAAPPADPPLVPILRMRGEIVILGSDYDLAAAGTTASIGLRFAPGFSAALLGGYFSALGGGRSEADAAIELEKDFSPESNLGLVLLARFGSAFLLGEGDPRDAGIRPFGQLGVGMRADLDPRIALTLDVRGMLRFRPAASEARAEPVTGGLVITMGLALALD